MDQVAPKVISSAIILNDGTWPIATGKIISKFDPPIQCDEHTCINMIYSFKPDGSVEVSWTK
jgi:hypothetical protein